MSVGSRIKEARKLKKLSQPALSNLCGWDSQTRISNYERDFRTPGLSDLEKLANVLGVNLNWLATGEGPKIKVNQGVTLFEMFKKAGEQIGDIPGEDRELFDDDFEFTPELEERLREIDRAHREGIDESLFADTNLISEQFAKIKKFDVELSAGHGASVGEESANSFLYFRKDWLERKELDEKNLCIVYVKGHSMEPTINDQEVILVDSSEYYTHRENVDDGFIYAISVDGEAMIKRLFKKPGGGLIVRSDSPAPQYRDMVLEGADLDYLRIIGRAIWHAGDL